MKSRKLLVSEQLREVRKLCTYGYGAAYCGLVAANPFYESSAFGVAFVLTLVSFSKWLDENWEGGKP